MKSQASRRSTRVFQKSGFGRLPSPDILDLGVARLRDGGTWEISVALAEFVRDDPLEADMRQQLHAALQGVSGVQTVSEHDRETWDVTGTPSGEDLIRARCRCPRRLGQPIP